LKREHVGSLKYKRGKRGQVLIDEIAKTQAEESLEAVFFELVLEVLAGELEEFGGLQLVPAGAS